VRVLFLNPVEGWGGAEKWMLEAAVGLERRGHHAFVRGRESAEWVPAYRARGVDAEPWPIRGDLHPRAVVRAARFLARERIDLVCAHLHGAVRLGGVAARLVGGVPVVVRKGLPDMKPGLRQEWTYRTFLDGIVTPAEAVRRELLRYPFFHPSRVRVVRNGVRVPEERPDPIARAALRERLGLRRARVLVFAARFHPNKGHRFLLPAFASLVRDFPDARLLLVGDGPLRHELTLLADRLRIRSKVVFAGFRADVDEVLPLAEVFVLPSLAEGLPNAVLEAMAAGLPVVATAVGGVPELVQEGRTGFLVPPGDPGPLADRLRILLREPDRGRRMGDAGRDRARREFTMDRMVDGVERVFGDAVAGTWESREP